jgi:hypothetical protein
VKAVVLSTNTGTILWKWLDVVQGYLAPGVHGTYRQYVLELLVVLGLLLPWIGPLFGRAVMTPIVLLTVQNGKIITTERDCFGGGVGPTECPADSYFDYYFWNITNPDQVSHNYTTPAAASTPNRQPACKRINAECSLLYLVISLNDDTGTPTATRGGEGRGAKENYKGCLSCWLQGRQIPSVCCCCC